MFKVFQLCRSVYLLSKRLDENEAQQLRENYSIKSTQEGPERYITYSESDLKIDVIAEYTWANDVVIFTDSLRDLRNNSTELSPDVYDRVLKRLVAYFSCWGGKVSLSDQKLSTGDDLKTMLKDSNIPFSETEDGTIHFSADVDVLRSKHIPPFDK